MIIPKIDEFFAVTPEELKIDVIAANKDTAFIRVVSPLMPNNKRIPQTSIPDTNNNINSNKDIDNRKITTTTTASSITKEEKKRGWLW